MHSSYLRIAHFPVRKATPLSHLSVIYLYEALSSCVAVIRREALCLSAGFGENFLRGKFVDWQNSLLRESLE